MTALIFDTETTGLIQHPDAKIETQPQIIEWAGVLIDEAGEVLMSGDFLINPGVPLPEVITKITGITDEQLVGQPSFLDASSLIRPYFAGADVMIAHNLPFDSTMMLMDLGRAQIFDWPWPKRGICTVQEHTAEFGHRPKLTELYEHYMGRPLAQKHRALDDVHALVRIAIAAGVVK